MNRKLPASLALLAALIVAAPILAAGKSEIFKGMPIERFNDADWALLEQAAHELLERPTVGDSRGWRNEASGNSGSIKVLEIFTRFNGTPCRRVEVQSLAGTLENTSKLTACKAGDGTWKLLAPGT